VAPHSGCTRRATSKRLPDSSVKHDAAGPPARLKARRVSTGAPGSVDDSTGDVFVTTIRAVAASTISTSTIPASAAPLSEPSPAR